MIDPRVRSTCLWQGNFQNWKNSREAATGVVSFDLSAEGGIRNVSITGSGADIEEANRAAVMQKLRRSIYRPAIAQGETVDSHVVIAAGDL